MAKIFSRIDTPPHTAREVSEILNHIPPAPENSDWVKICAGVCSEIGEAEALPVLLAWSPDFGDKKTETVLRSFRGKYKSTFATVIKFAQANGFDASRYEKARFERVKAENGNGFTKRKEPAKAPATLPEKEQPTRSATPQNDYLPPVKIGKCSYCESVRKPASVKETDLRACVNAIKAGKWKKEIEELRSGKREKSTLPQINAFGVYREKRADENLSTRSGFIVLDYDGKDNSGTDFHKLKTRLSRLPFVFAAFTSPSGNGLKALIRIPATVSDAAGFEAARMILAPLGGKIDAQSEARKHFIVSADDSAFINPKPFDEIAELPANLEELSPAVLAVLFADTVERFYYSNESGNYYFLDSKSGFITLNSGNAIEEFTIIHGVKREAARRLLIYIRHERAVSEVFRALSCRPRGRYFFNNRQVLVLESPFTIEADEGQFPTIRRMLETVFPERDFEQLARFLAWLKIARAAYLRAVESDGATVSPVPLLMLLGTAGAGKDLLFGSLINPALGNRERGGMDTWTQERPWLGINVGKECILGTELRTLPPKERNDFTQTIKAVLGGEGYTAERKNKDAFTYKGQHFLVLLANIDEGGNCAACCPDTKDKDFKDKFLALAVSNAPAVKAAFPTAKRAENAAAIRRELPAFLYWLETYFDFSDEWKDERFGLTQYTAPAAASALYEVSLAAELEGKLALMCETNPARMYDKAFPAAEIAEMLYSRFGGKMLSSVAAGKGLTQLCEARPDFIEYAAHKYRFKRGATDKERNAPALPACASPFVGLPF